MITKQTRRVPATDGLRPMIAVQAYRSRARRSVWGSARAARMVIASNAAARIVR